MSKGKEKLIPVLAIIVILIGISCSLYVNAKELELEKKYSGSNQESIINIANQDYDLNELFSIIQVKTIQTDEEERIGLALDELIIYVGVSCLSCHEYTFKAKDGYQQTVKWENLETGVLTEEARVYFPGLAHAFWVRNIVEIEVR